MLKLRRTPNIYRSSTSHRRIVRILLNSSNRTPSLPSPPTTRPTREPAKRKTKGQARRRRKGGGSEEERWGASRDRYLGDSAISRGRQISVNPGSLARLMPGFHLRARQAEGKVWDGWVTIHRRRCHCRPPPPLPRSCGCNEVGGLGVQRVPYTRTYIYIYIYIYTR